ncbi:hypothetical protein ABZS76_32875 [Streptomyces sp. NPDC005562]|uniref:hypothetical protein n=1 Tax=Streptomyces sp. NPDC005562 TaxID=3154890 RepID=UPI0033B74629
MDPTDVTPLRTDPDTVANPDRQRAHRRRYDAQTAADAARARVLGALTLHGVSTKDATALTDGLITALRTADAHRLEHARASVHEYEQHQAWVGIDDLNDGVEFLLASTHAFPVRQPESPAPQADDTEQPAPGMTYTVTVTKPDGTVDDSPKAYNDATAVHMLRTALGHGYTLTAAASTSVITLALPGRNTITLRPARPLPKPTPPQRREILALASSRGPIEWTYGSTNVLRLQDGARKLTHQTVMSLIKGGYLPDFTGRHEGRAELTLQAYLTMGCAYDDGAGAADATLASALTSIYRRPVAA